MNETLKEFLREVVLSLGIPGVDSSSFGLENSVRDAANADIFFDLTVLSKSAVKQVTEISTVRPVTGIIGVSVPFGEGSERVDRIVEGLLDVFSPYNPRRKELVVSETVPIFQGGFSKKRRVARATNVELTSGYAVNGRYGVNLYVHFEINEERLV